MLSIDWYGQTLHLLPERAVLWHRAALTRPNSDVSGGVLVVADLHLGKSAAFRAAGIPVPEVIDADLHILTDLIERFAPDHLVIAGDFLHARAGRSESVFAPFRAWRSKHAALDVILVRGNHDRTAGDPPADLHIRVEDEPFRLAPDDALAIAHDPDAARPDKTPVLCGHLHPSISIGDGCSSLRAPCFWLRQRELILPARGRFTGTRAIRPTSGDRVFAVGDNQVVELRAAVRARSAPVTMG